MKTRSSSTNLDSAFFYAAVFAALCICNGAAFAAPQSISNDKELAAALKSVKTPDDHRRIAAYYEEKAKKLEKREKEERGMADYFATHPSMYGKIYPTPYQNHKSLSEYYQRAAGDALQKARQHQDAAESLSAAPR